MPATQAPTRHLTFNQPLLDSLTPHDRYRAYLQLAEDIPAAFAWHASALSRTGAAAPASLLPLLAVDWEELRADAALDGTVGVLADAAHSALNECHARRRAMVRAMVRSSTRFTVARALKVSWSLINADLGYPRTHP